MIDPEKPYVLCGCFRAATEEQALIYQQIARDVLDGSGFTVEHIEREDDVETRRTVAA